VPQFVSLDSPSAIETAERALQAGKVIVLPTDTVYGLAALPGIEAAVDRLYLLKGRPEAVPIAVLVGSPEQVESIAGPLLPEATRLMAALWPGPLTVVVPRRDGLGTIGVRCPDHDFVRSLANRVGPIAVTSANRHGEPTPATAMDAATSLDGEVELVVVGGPCGGMASTVVDGTDADLPILRQGPLRREHIVAVALR
jgi:tRNA threonylcarbamoyl adenosine modification protein (Sua5/YciO/YrdC/YwlC family)